MWLWVVLFPCWGLLLLLLLLMLVVVVLWRWLRRVRCSPWVSVPLVPPAAILEDCRHVARGRDLGCGRGVVDAVRWWWHSWNLPRRDLAELHLPPPSGLIWILQGETASSLWPYAHLRTFRERQRGAQVHDLGPARSCQVQQDPGPRHLHDMYPLLLPSSPPAPKP